IRWMHKNKVDNIRAAKAFIRIFNKKLFDNIESEMTWTRWYFPMINTDETIKKIDLYYQECIRYIVTEKRSKSKYNCTYEDMKNMGYKSLVHEYYKLKKLKTEELAAYEKREKLGRNLCQGNCTSESTGVG
ncbi:MAG: hypothetical protein HUJ58_05440, partial [Erysipelotrichaceae bacterium]|nr:hypothetical protein [Erysipelotrichaceae bacterium]